MLRHAARVNGVTGLAINHIDVLAGLDTVEVGHAYRLDGDVVETMPTTTERWGRCEATYRTFDGWPDVDWSEVAAEGYEALPENARTYLEYISDELDTPVYAVGVGAGREETVVRENPFEQ
jgi:adenylosuccinate synthase